MKVQAYFHTLGVQVCAEQNWTCRGLCHMGEPWTESDTLFLALDGDTLESPTNIREK